MIALHGNVDDSSAHVFAIKPRAFGAPQSGMELDGSTRPSKWTTVPPMENCGAGRDSTHAVRTMSDR